jgi:1-acyl-sn-glycerol-3-phosphate acyltransferase
MSPGGLATSRWWHRRLARILGIRVTVVGAPPQRPVVFAATHLSWADIPVLGSAADCAFLSKDEVRDWPVVGWLSARAGTLFIRRGDRRSATETIDTLTAALAAGRQVMLFPEGTTTRGEVRRFKGRLLQAAVTAGVPVQPVALSYPAPEGGTHPLVPFVDDMGFMAHLLELMASPAQRLALGASGREWAQQRFDPTLCAQRHLELLQQHLAARAQ